MCFPSFILLCKIHDLVVDALSKASEGQSQPDSCILVYLNTDCCLWLVNNQSLPSVLVTLPMKKCNVVFHRVSFVWKSIPKSMKTLMALQILKGQRVLSFFLYCSICLYLFVGLCFALSFPDIISSPLEYIPKTWSWFIQYLTCEEKEGKG